MIKVGIIGAGPAGCACAKFLQDSASVTLFDFASPLRTLLPTGGGRCNLAHAEYDFKELVKNYPRGEKFLYSIFSRFSTSDTIDFFESIGIKTYTQDDFRIFPESNSSKQVREMLLKALNKTTIKREKALRLEDGEKLKLITDMNSYYFDSIIIATGGHASYELFTRLGINIIEPKPALVGLLTKEKLSNLSGVVIENCKSEGMIDNLLFTHKGISGPLIYKISSLKAKNNFPYTLNIDLCPKDIDLQDLINSNPHKQINNLLSDYIPKRVVNYILEVCKISSSQKCHLINAKQRDCILEKIHSLNLTIIGTSPDGEVVTAGGVDLKEINPKTLESKKVKGLYFIGEVLDIDGFCGGFNLQNCWSTAFVASNAILSM